jgi:selenocysteine-specific elongation factor
LPTVVIGTAGHIDHGKTALLRALTGIDADRLPEEKARGMTIDVGYAHMAFDDGVELDFVDVPGHDRLIGNMLVGAGEIDAAMLVVAADDGPRPQTLEHLELLDALGLRHGLAVITKTDLVGRARVERVLEEIRGLLTPTWLASAPILAASPVSGDGLDGVRSALRELRDRIVLDRHVRDADSIARRPVRIAIDRVFTAKGRGVVVTGSLRGGEVRPGDALRREPGGEVVRVREVQVHGHARESADGGRTALNVAGLGAADIRRGDVLTAGPRVRGTSRLLIQRSEEAPRARPRPWPPKAGSRLRLHIGTDQVDGRVRRLRGLDAQVLLDLDRPVASFTGDRAILREPGQGTVVAGVTVLDAAPPRGVSARRMTRERLAALAGEVAAGDPAGVEAARVELHGALATPVAEDAGHPATRSVALAADVIDALVATALEAVAGHHRDAPLSAGMPLPRARAALGRRLRSLATVERRDADAAAAAVSRLVDRLVAEGRLVRDGDALRDSARTEGRPAPLVQAMGRLEAALAVPAPPALSEAAAAAGCPPEGVRALQADGRIVRIGTDLAWESATYRRLAATALELARTTPVTPAAFRDATGTSRKYVLAILEDLDRREILRRTPEGHVPGPRAPRPQPVGEQVGT